MKVCPDGVHGFGAEEATPDAPVVDFLVTGTRKWLFGPRGTGLVRGRPQAWSRYAHVIPRFVDTTGAVHGPWSTPGGFHSFEHRWALISDRLHRRRTGTAALPRVEEIHNGRARSSRSEAAERS